METDYECYLLGCRSAGVKPLGRWRFRLLQQAYLRLVAEQEKDPHRILVPSATLERLAALVESGYKIAAGNNREDEPGTAGCGVHAPHGPLDPLLTASAAKPLPSPIAPDQSFWRV